MIIVVCHFITGPFTSSSSSFILFPLLCGVDEWWHNYMPPVHVLDVAGSYTSSPEVSFFDKRYPLLCPTILAFLYSFSHCTFISITFLPTQCSFLLVTCQYSRTADERPSSPTTIPLIRPYFLWRTVVSVRIRIPHERPSLLYDHTNVILRVVV